MLGRATLRGWRWRRMRAAQRMGQRPQPWSGAGRAALIIAMAALGSFFLLDPVMHQLTRRMDAASLSFFDSITGLGRAWWILWPSGIAIVVLSVLFRREASRKLSALYQHWIGVCCFIFASVALSHVIVNAVKFLVGRARPRLYESHGPFEFSPLSGAADYASFPSGHAATAFALAAALGLMLPRLRPALYSAAVAAGFSRIALGKHYFTDVVVGALIAIAVAYALMRWFEARGVVFARRSDGRRAVKGAASMRWAMRAAGARVFG